MKAQSCAADDANEAGGSDSSWNEKANRERLEAAAPAQLNGSDSGGSVGVGACHLRVRATRPRAGVWAFVSGCSGWAWVCVSECVVLAQKK